MSNKQLVQEVELLTRRLQQAKEKVAQAQREELEYLEKQTIWWIVGLCDSQRPTPVLAGPYTKEQANKLVEAIAESDKKIRYSSYHPGHYFIVRANQEELDRGYTSGDHGY